ncbi:hypothetical protein FLONG3_8487 [Fusarium longipes]|uniref:Uncharacterized protein n=1 Tax=Fusarium longipes TaxID=694270 RepID=A0A395S517_9HYPO|nr:hypothetical protein FLONG3_8487 [Fusarium longipes]
MTDPAVTYINVIQHLASVPYPRVWELPRGISAGASPKGPSRKTPPGNSDMYEKLLGYAEFRTEEYILAYNQQKLGSMFALGRWNRRESTQSETCSSIDCQEPLALGTQLCCEHALEVVDKSAVFTPVRQAVERTLNKASTATIRTLEEAADFFSNPKKGYDGITAEEREFLRDLIEEKEVYFTDTESIGNLLLQVSVIDSGGRHVFGGYINNDCATVQEIWDLAMKRNDGKLTFWQELMLRKAFGPPSSKKATGYNMRWVADQFGKLKESAPDMKIAEWSNYPFDQTIYRTNLLSAGIHPDDFLPPPSNWVSPMTWFQRTEPSLAGHSLGYVACLYAPSELVWKWHDAIADTRMLFDIVSTRANKLFDGAVTVSPPISIQRLFEGREPGDDGSTTVRTWMKAEEDLCYQYVEEQLSRDSSIGLWDLMTSASYFLNKKNSYRTAHAINEHLRKAVLASEAPSRQAHILPLFRQALSSQIWTKKTAYRRSTSRPEVKAMADAIVQDLYGQRDLTARATQFTTKLFWHETRRHAHQRVEDHPGLTTQDVDLALLVLQNRQGAPGMSQSQVRDREKMPRLHKFWEKSTAEKQQGSEMGDAVAAQNAIKKAPAAASKRLYYRNKAKARGIQIPEEPKIPKERRCESPWSRTTKAFVAK